MFSKVVITLVGLLFLVSGCTCQPTHDEWSLSSFWGEGVVALLLIVLATLYSLFWREGQEPMEEVVKELRASQKQIELEKKRLAQRQAQAEKRQAQAEKRQAQYAQQQIKLLKILASRSETKSSRPVSASVFYSKLKRDNLIGEVKEREGDVILLPPAIKHDEAGLTYQWREWLKENVKDPPMLVLNSGVTKWLPDVNTEPGTQAYEDSKNKPDLSLCHPSMCVQPRSPNDPFPKSFLEGDTVQADKKDTIVGYPVLQVVRNALLMEVKKHTSFKSGIQQAARYGGMQNEVHHWYHSMECKVEDLVTRTMVLTDKQAIFVTVKGSASIQSVVPCPLTQRGSKQVVLDFVAEHLAEVKLPLLMEKPARNFV